MKTLRYLNSGRWLALLVMVVAFGCRRGAEPVHGDKKADGPVFAFVAASTKEAVQEIASLFHAETKTDVKINADDSSKLATQIVHEAPAHVFLSANEKWVDFVKEKGFAAESQPLLGNQLVIVVPKGNPAKISKPEDLPTLKRLAVAGPTVPAGIYARQTLTKLDLWAQLEADKKIVSSDNVRVALTYVELNEVEAGIVYATDAMITKKVETVYTFPSTTHDPIRYPLVLLKAGKALPAAQAFYDFVKSAKAKEIFAKHGFSLLDAK